MYKSKLQEYCHSKAWALPEYATSIEGPPHDPRFKAVVEVNGLKFATSHFSKSSKLAQNEVAKLAFEHFIGSSSPSVGSQVLHAPSDVSHSTAQETSDSARVSETSSSVVSSETFKDQGYLCKSQLQIYAQKRNLALPSYTTEHEGPPHASRFKSRVHINGRTYDSPDFCKTVKQAENAAAKVALMSLPPDGVKEVDPIFCKNLLQEFVQREYSCLPKYNTIQSGASHVPHFVSTVEIKGEIFQGQEAKTKKQSEMNAAMVAYAALKKGETKSPCVSNDGVIDSSQREIIIQPRNVLDGDQESAISSSSIMEKQKTEPSGGASSQETIIAAATISHSPLYHSLPVAMTHAQSSESDDLVIGGGAGTSPSNVGRHIVVYPRGAKVIFPPGTSTSKLHGDDKWTAMTVRSNQ